MGIANFKKRKANIKPIAGLSVKEAIVGFSTESILEVLGGTLEPLLDELRKGTIKLLI